MISKLSLQALANLQRMRAATASDVRAPAQAKQAEAGKAQPEPHGAPSLEQQVRRGVAGIHPDDPRRRQRALRVLVEASLLREFGDHMNADPAFHAIVDQVAAAMDEEPALGGAISQALDAILSPQNAG